MADGAMDGAIVGSAVVCKVGIELGPAEVLLLGSEDAANCEFILCYGGNKKELTFVYQL